MSYYVGTIEQTRSKSWVRDFWIVFGAVLLVSLAGRVALPLPFTPIPVTLQCHVCLLVGALLSPRLSLISMTLFLLLGALEFPIFSQGKAGLATLLSPTGGYLVGYLMATKVIGYLIQEKQFSSPERKTLAMGIGNLVIYAFGLPQLALFVGIEKVFLLGMLPFLVGDMLKLYMAYCVMKGVGTFRAID